jgi:MerR family transcriptional regulator/heat shock protein HspR
MSTASDRDTRRAVYVISVAAELAGVHPQTLRNYERSGLLDPSRTAGGSRRFSEADLTRLRRIQELTGEGLNLEGVRRVLRLEEELAALREELERRELQHRQELAELQRFHRREIVPLNQSLSPLRAFSRRGWPNR